MTERYWLWRDDVSVSGVQPIASIQNLGDFTSFGSMVGCPLPNEFPTFRLKAAIKGPLPDYFSTGRFRFVSERLRSLLANLNIPGIEYRSILMRHRGQELPKRSYFHFHVVKAADCLDRNRSIYEIEQGPKGPYIKTLRKLYLDETLIAGEQLFSLTTPGAESALIASDGLAETILRSGCTGCEFKAPKDIRNYFDNPEIKTFR